MYLNSHTSLSIRNSPSVSLKALSHSCVMQAVNFAFSRCSDSSSKLASSFKCQCCTILNSSSSSGIDMGCTFLATGLYLYTLFSAHAPPSSSSLSSSSLSLILLTPLALHFSISASLMTKKSSPNAGDSTAPSIVAAATDVAALEMTPADVLIPDNLRSWISLWFDHL